MPENFKNEANNDPDIQLISFPNPSKGDSKTCWKIISKKHPKCDPQGPHKGPLFCSNPTLFPPLAPQVPTPGANQEPQMPQACQSRIQDLLLGVILGHFMTPKLPLRCQSPDLQALKSASNQIGAGGRGEALGQLPVR